MKHTRLVTLFAIAVLMALAPLCAASESTNGLVLHFPFTGSAADSSGAGNDGVLNGARLSTDRFGRTNSALQFNGAGDFLQTGAPLPDSDSITVSLWLSLDRWVNVGDWGQPQVLFFEGDDGGGHDVACYVVGGFHFVVKSNDKVSYPNWLPPLQSWIHLVCLADSTNKSMSIWIDGKKVAENEFTQNAGVGFHSPFNLGRRPGVYNDWFFAGSVDDVRVYNRALSDGEIVSLHASERGVVSAVEIELETIRLTLNVIPGVAYVLQSSTDLKAWTTQGAYFTTTAVEHQVSVNAADGGRYWRLVRVP